MPQVQGPTSQQEESYQATLERLRREGVEAMAALARKWELLPDCRIVRRASSIQE